jgi:hypothetical protein
MSFQQVPAGNGLQWLTGSINLILKNPAPFALMGLLVGVIAMVPILGGLALLILGPALYGGIMYAAREQVAGRKADFPQLFQAFREEGKLGKMMMLCLPGIAAGIVIAVLAVVVLGGALLGAGVSSSSNAGAGMAAAFGLGGVLFLLIALAVGLASYALTFFATPAVMLDSAEPVAAMKQSFQACLANLGAILVYVGILIVVTVVLSVVLGWIPLLGHLLLMTALMPVVAVAGYLAWTQVYRGDTAQELPPVAPPPPSVDA